MPSLVKGRPRLARKAVAALSGMSVWSARVSRGLPDSLRHVGNREALAESRLGRFNEWMKC
jgi:hypothetical protein